MTLLDRVHETLRRRDEALAVAAVRRSSARPRAIRARRVGYRHVIAAAGALDRAAVGELVEAFRQSIQAGAQEVWIELSTSRRLAPEAVEALAELSASARESRRRLALVVPRGPAHEALRREAGVEVYDSRTSAQRASP